MTSEFSIIEDYFKPISAGESSINVGIGDDGAVLSIPSNKQLVVVTDTSIEAVHFPKNTAPFDIAWKSLAVNLSDLAAMGATPAFFSLALSLPAELNRTDWLSEFALGLKTLSKRYSISLVGGDTTKSDVLSITITANGWVDSGKAILRSNAKQGDLIFVSGNIGEGGLGLQKIADAENFKSVVQHLNKPEPRVELGLNLVGLANSAIDISDGLLVDLKHILTGSGVSAKLDYDTIPFSLDMQNYIQETEDYFFPLTCGDDYELCFSVPKHKLVELDKIKKTSKVHLTCIGEICDGEVGSVSLTSNNKSLQQKINSFKLSGFKHFV